MYFVDCHVWAEIRLNADYKIVGAKSTTRDSELVQTLETVTINVRDIIKFYQLRLVYDFHCTTLPTDLMSLFKLSSEVRTNNYQNLNSIVNRLLYIPKFKGVTYGKQSLRYHVPKLWNETFKTGSIQVNSEKNIQLAKIYTVYSFKNALKRHYLHYYSIATD